MLARYNRIVLDAIYNFRNTNYNKNLGEILSQINKNEGDE